MTTRNGLVYEYGGTPDARVHAGGLATVRTWALSQVRDRVGVGNRISLSYENDAQPGAYTNGTQRIARITYPHTATGAGPFYEVRFSYSPRPGSDVPMGYLAGHVLREPNKLDAISVHATGSETPIKAYRLSYAPAPYTFRLRLTGVQECAAASCFRPTQFSYQNGSIGWQLQRDAGVTTTAEQRTHVADFNGDGRTDLLYPVSAGGGKVAWWVLRGAVDGFANPVYTGFVTTGTTSAIIVGQFRGNGRAQFLVQRNGAWSVAGFVGESLFVENTGLAVGGEHSAADFDGDGLDDLVAVTASTPRVVSVRRNTTVPAAAGNGATFAAVAQNVYTVPDTRVLRSSPNPRVADFDGDGRSDLLLVTSNTLDRLSRQFVTAVLSNGFDAPATVGAEHMVTLQWMLTTGDWNADGCADVIQGHEVRISNCAGGFRTLETYPTPATGDGSYTVLALDRDADGRTDLLYVDRATNTWYLIPSTGEGAAPARATGIPAPLGTAWFVHDADGDGLVDLGVRDLENRLRYRRSVLPGEATDLLAAVVDGFGNRQGVTYASIARGHHEREGGAQFPEADFQAPLYVVSELSATDGSGANYQLRYSYSGARRHLQGRGFLGFGRQRVVDSRSGLVTEDRVERSFPFTGTHLERTVLQSNGATPVSRWASQVAQRVTGGAAHETRVFGFVAAQTSQRYEHGGTLDGELVTETSTTYSYDDAYGKAAGASGFEPGRQRS